MQKNVFIQIHFVSMTSKTMAQKNMRNEDDSIRNTHL